MIYNTVVLATAWKAGEVRPTQRKQPGAARSWRTRKDPFEHTWPMIRQWLDSKTTITAKEITERLTIIMPNEYSGSSQLRTLQRRIKQWHEEQAKDLVMGQLRRSTAVHGCEEKLDASPPVKEQTTT